MREIELKLDIEPADVAALENAGELTGSKPCRRRQVTVYFDTPAQALRASGMSLRIRRSGAKRIQTIKAESRAAAGLFARAEWEQDVAGDAPVLDGVSEAIAPLLAQAGPAELKPAFTTRVRRTSWDLMFQGSSIELVLDQGEIAAAGRKEAISEIEIELKQGDPAALFGLARALAARVPLRLGVLAKSERGYRLLAGPPDRAIKSEAAPLIPDMDAAAAFVAIAHACLRQYRLNEALLLLRTRTAPPLHQARVALRRLRSALSLFRPMLDDARFAHLAGELRWLAGQLGTARNLDVLLDRAGDAPFAAMLSEAREQSYDEVVDALSSPRSRDLLLELVEWLATGGWLTMESTAELRGRPVERFARDVLDRARKRVKRRGKRLATIDDEARHAVRIAAKKLRYAAEFFAPLYTAKPAPRRRKAFLGALEQLQTHLGDLNDQATGREVLAALGLPEEAARALLDGRIDRKRLLADAADAFEELIDVKRFWR